MPKVTISFEVDDIAYQNFIRKIGGVQNIERYFRNFVNDYGKDDDKYPPMYQRFGGLPNLKIPDNFDDIEVTADELFGIK